MSTARGVRAWRLGGIIALVTDTQSSAPPAVKPSVSIMRIGLGILSLALLVTALALAYREMQAFLSVRGRLPDGSAVAGVPVGGLTYEQAAQRLSDAYAQPVVLLYQDSLIYLQPEQAGFQLDLQEMLPPPQMNGGQDLWMSYWHFLLGQSTPPIQAPLMASHSAEALHAFLQQEIQPRYDRPPLPARYDLESLRFIAGSPGTQLDVSSAVLVIEEALYSLEGRRVVLPVSEVSPAALKLDDLAILLQHTLASSGFDGLTGLYLYDLEREEALHFAQRQGSLIPVAPDIAFTASSLMKIPILVSVYRRIDGPPDDAVNRMIMEMIRNSSNDAADWLMRSVLDEVRGPLLVSEDLQSLGIENTFLGGYFALGSPLLQIYETPANRRTDISTNPDIYSQTTPSDMGRLLAEIYTCAHAGDGLLRETFPAEITQAECQAMISALEEDRLPYLITAGLPDGTPIAHKHGYGINTISDAGIITSPGGDYVLTMFFDHPEHLNWDSTNRLAALLSQTIYGYFNPEPMGGIKQSTE